MIALVDALSCFDVSPRQVHVLSIGTGSRRPTIGLFKAVGGKLAWMDAHNSFVFHGSKNADGQAGLLVGRDQLKRFEPAGEAASIDMTDVDSARSILPTLGEQDADAAFTDLVKYFFSSKAPPLAFHYGSRASK
jgi:hypothetical protein